MIGQVYAYTDEEILAALQRKIELLDPDSAMYLTDKDEETIANFLKQNEHLFASLGAKETLYYIKLVELNRNQNVTRNVAQYAVESYKKYFEKYNPTERSEIERNLTEFKNKHFISQAQLEEVYKLKSQK